MDDYSYYSLDDILVDAEPIPVVFRTDAYDLGWLDEQAVDDPHLRADTRVELPTWLVSHLCTREMIFMELPRPYQPSFREMLLADATVVDLGDKSPYYYELGIKIGRIITDPALGNTMCHSLNSRFLEIVTRTANRKQAESLEFLSKLSHLERRLFDSKHAGVVQLRKMHDRSGVQLTIAPVLAALQGHANAIAPQGSNSAIRGRPHGVAGALRNITNGQSVPGSDRRTQNNTGTQKPSSTQKPPSTLAHLSALNASNLPLASHQQRRFGMAATQARDVAQRTLNQAREAQRGALSAAAATQAERPAAQSARKRKIGQNK